MGAGSSKPETSEGSRHVFSSTSPIQFSANLVEALQTSAETDSTRAKTLELQIQARVAQELERIRAREQQTLRDIEKRLAEAKTADAPTTTPAAISTTSPTQGSLDLDAPRIPFAGRDSAPVATEGQTVAVAVRDISRDSVASEIQELRSKLDGRRKLMELPEGVEKARNEVVSCLRLNDRRPLDCWKEVEGFKKEVARLEEAFVDRIVG